MKIKDLKKGAFFTRKQVENPKGSQVYIRGEFDREQKKYECVRWDDASRFIYLKGDTEVFTEFTF